MTAARGAERPELVAVLEAGVGIDVRREVDDSTKDGLDVADGVCDVLGIEAEEVIVLAGLAEEGKGAEVQQGN